jgi:hypothetical protein
LQCAAVQDRRRWLPIPAFGQAQQRPQIGDYRLEGAGRKPAARLLVHEDPGRQVMGQRAPGRTGPDQVTQRVEDLAQIVMALA